MTNFYKSVVACFNPEEKQKKTMQLMLTFFLLFSVFELQAQTTIINPAAEGGFNSGSTFESNGWTVANQGVSPVKWAVGTAASGTTSVGLVTAASTSVTLTAPNVNIVVGQIVYGSGIPVNTFVSAISGTALTLSQPATISTASATLGFGKFSGGISVGVAQLTTASIAAASFTITLAAANPNISVGMAIAPIANIIGANTYVASINGTTLGLSQATLGAAAVAQTLTFTATSSAISGNAAYITNDNGLTNSYGGYPTNRTVYFYRDITTVPANETAMTLTFDVKSAPASGGGWQVWAAPITQTITGTDTQVTAPFTNGVSWPGATLISFNSNPQVATTKTTAFIPKSFAGTSFRLIFVWTNGTSAGTLPPAAIDNISLTSRTPEEITCAQSGLWSQTATWDGGKVPTLADTVVLDGANEFVLIDSRYSGCEDLILAGTNTLVQFAISTILDEFTINNDLNLAASGARFNNHDVTNGKYLKLGHNLDVAAGARFDSQLGFTASASRINLNGTVLQTVTVDPAGFFGGSAAGVNTSSNVANVLGTLEVTNTASTSPNVIWDADGIRIKTALTLTTGRIKIAAGKRLILGNFSGLSNITCPTGYGITEGTLSKWMASTSSAVISNGTEYPNTDNGFKSFWYPYVNGSNLNRSMYLLANANPTVSGEIAVTYTDATSLTTGLSITDGNYTINNRYGANWTFSTPNSSVTGTPLFLSNAAGTYRLAVHAPGAYAALDGASRLMNLNAALPGTHQDGTAMPFMVRNGLTIADLTALPIYIGVGDGSKVASSNTVTSTVNGGDRDWNTAASWVGGVVPTCTNNVIIASGATVNITTTADAASVVINAGGTLVNNGGATTMTVGCANNNAAFINFGSHTMNSGTLKVNGFVAHKNGSTFNQTGGDIVIDSNNNGDAATSVAFGGSSCKIETSSLALSGGKITIVDPLVNISAPVSVTSLANFNIATEGANGKFNRTTNAAATSGATTLTFAISNGANIITAGQSVTGTGIAANTTVVSSTPNGFGTVTTVILSSPIIANVASGGTVTFSSMSNGCSGIVFAASATNTSLAVGQGVSGPGIQAGTTITNIAFTGIDSTTFNGKITLSLPVSGLGTSPINGVQTLTIAAVTPGASSTTLPAANSNLTIGMPVTGNGLLTGTFITDIAGANVTFSNPIQVGAPSPLVFNAYPFNTQSSGSFIYASPNHYATGINHTLQIGDGISTQNTALITTGFNCQFQALGGLMSIGNLIVDAPNGSERFMNVSSNNVNAGVVPSGYNINIQNALTITAGSVFKKTFANAPVYVGGNIINNGSLLMPRGQQLHLGNIINGVLTPTALPQTISGSGTFLANEWSLTGSGTFPGFSVGAFTVNNTSAEGVTIGVPNFRTNGVTLTNGIVHTTATNTIYVGAPDVMNATYNPGTFNFSTGVTGSATCHIDGPIVHANKFEAGITQNRLYPVGKNGKYLPITIASTGGVELMAEAFDTNSGTTNPANASNLSSNRWKVTRVGSLGNFTGYNVRLGSLTSPVTASNLIVQAATENGTYDIVSTPSSTITYDLSHFSLTNLPTITLATAQTGGFLGNFSYADGPVCSGTPSPVAAASTTSLCSGQSTTLSLSGLSGAGLTYQWQNSIDGISWNNISGATSAIYIASPVVDTFYQCIVTCSSTSGISNTIAVTVSQSTAITTGATISTICASGIANLTASGSSILNWYDAPTGGNLVATGSSYSPAVASTTNFYVSSSSVSTGSAGATTWTGAAASSALFSGIAFNVTNKVKLKTVTVYPKNTSALTPITIALFDAAGNIVSGTTPVTFTPTLVTGTLGTTSQNVTLNYNIPVGTGYRLVATYGLAATTNTLGNSTTAITYPTSGAISLTGNVTNLTSAVTTTANTTSCFHNLTFDEVCESVTRTPVTATVVMEQPTSPTICKVIGATASTSITASGSVTYQWQVLLPTSTAVWTNISNNANYSGATSATLNITRTTTSLPATGTKYRVVVNGGTCANVTTSNVTLGEVSVLSKAATITAKSATNTTLSPALTTCEGSSVNLTLAAGSVGNIQWQSSTDGTNFTNFGSLVQQAALSAVNSALTMSSGNLTQDTWFRVVATNGVCNSATSAAIKITVSTAPTAGSISGGNVTVCAPLVAPSTTVFDASGNALTTSITNSTTLSLTGNSTTSIVWQKSINFENATNAAPVWSTVAGATASDLVVSNLAADTWFRAKVTNGACVSYTDEVKISVSKTAKAGTVTSPTTVCSGGSITFTSAAYTGSAIAWQVSTTSATSGFETVAGANELTFTMNNVTLVQPGQKFYVRSVVTSGACTQARSAVKTVTMDRVAVATTITGNTGVTTALTAICTTATKTLTLGAGYVGTIQWQKSTTSATEGFEDVVGATLRTYAASSTTEGNVWFRVKMSSGLCSVVYSTPVNVWFKSCNTRQEAPITIFTVKGYPNPYSTNFTLSIDTPSEAMVYVSVYDMTGKLIENREVMPSALEDVQLGSNWSTGVYNVIVAQDNQVKTMRMIKK
jgi:hypothetical protein